MTPALEQLVAEEVRRIAEAQARRLTLLARPRIKSAAQLTRERLIAEGEANAKASRKRARNQK